MSPTGEFAVVSYYAWDLSDLYTSGKITLKSSLVGDANADGVVGLNDLNLVRNHFGDVGLPGRLGDTIPFDGVVDLADLNAVRNHFGSSQQPVPEPATAWLAISTFGAACFFRLRYSA